MKIKLYRDPNGGEGGGGGEPNPNPPAGGGEGAPAAEPWKAEFEGFRGELDNRFNEFGQRFEKITPFMDRIEKLFGGNQPAAQGDAEPNIQDPKYKGNSAQYVKDVAIWAAKNQTTQFSEQQKKSAAEQEEARNHQEYVNKSFQKHAGNVEAFRATTPDFDAVVSKGIIDAKESPKLTLEILNCDNSAAVEYHLAKNPQEAWKLISLFRSDVRKGQRVLDLMDEGFTAAKSAAPQGREFKPTNRTGGSSGKSNDVKSMVRDIMFDHE